MPERIQLVIDTLQDLDIKSTYDNMRKILGCINELIDIKRSIPVNEEAEPRIEIVEDKENGTAE
jgi:hypothetical protein